MSNVSPTWLVKTNVSLNTAVLTAASFQTAMIIGVFNIKPSSWGSAIFKKYTSAATANADFTPLISGTSLQAKRYRYLIKAISAFFAESPTPQELYVGQIPVPAFGTAFNYVTALDNLNSAFPYFIPASIADKLAYENDDTAQKSSVIVTIDVTVSGAQTLPVGWSVTGSASPTVPYTLETAFSIPSSGTYSVVLKSEDVLTAIPAASMTTPVAVSGVTFVSTTNEVAATLGFGQTAGFTGENGLVAGIQGLRSSANDKFFIADTSDNGTIAGQLQTAGGDKQLLITNHSLNFGDTNVSQAASVLQAYFGNVFADGVGLKVLSSMQLTAGTVDPVITTNNIDDFVDTNNNVYAGFGNGSGIGLMQYGYCSNSTEDAIVYMDQIVGSLYLKFRTQEALFNLILRKAPTGGLFYSDAGILELVTEYMKALQDCVNQKIIQPLENNQVTYRTYAQCEPSKISQRIYDYLAYNGKFLSRIQKITNQVNLSL